MSETLLIKYKPREYQIVGSKHLKSGNFKMLGDAPGVGKTGQAIIATEPFWRVLVICPASIKEQWRQAFIDWVGRKDFQIVRSSKDKLRSNISYIVNYDLVIRERILKQLMLSRFDLIICDESHKLKSFAAKRTKVVLSNKYLKSRTARMWFLTGTPVKNRTIDLYPVLKSCVPEILGPYNSYIKFSYRYCGAYQSQFGLDVSGASHTEELCERLKPFMLRREKREVITELPPRIVMKIDLECTPEVKKIIEAEELKTIEMAGTDDPAFFKLGEQARIRKVLAKYKVPISVDYIQDILEEENKVVVFYHHKEVLNALKEKFKNERSVFIDGSVNPNKRPEIIRIFQQERDVRLFFGQMQACGEGIDGLQDVCSTCVFVEPSWSHTDIEQCIGRLERSGQRSDVNVHILVIKDTQESKMMDTVTMKLNTDKKLYGVKEKTMVKKKTNDPMERIADALEALLELVKEQSEVRPTKELPASKNVPEEPIEVTVTTKEEITEEVIRRRAADVCSLKPDGTAKSKVVEVIKTIGGGKIADLKTPEQKQLAMEALDKLFNEFDV